MELERREEEERQNMNVEIEKEILIEERLRLEEEKIKMSQEMERFKMRMKELYIEDMIRRAIMNILDKNIFILKRNTDMILFCSNLKSRFLILNLMFMMSSLKEEKQKIIILKTT